MSGMNPFLAEMFNTEGWAEKVAETRGNVEMLLKVAEEENIDLSDLNEDEVVELANNLAEQAEGGEGIQEDAYPEYNPEVPESPENMGPKTAEVDFLGRYMAHANWDEMNKIAMHKEASKGGAWQKVKDIGGRYKDLLMGGSKKPQEFLDKAKAGLKAKSTQQSELMGRARGAEDKLTGLKKLDKGQQRKMDKLTKSRTGYEGQVEGGTQAVKSEKVKARIAQGLTGAGVTGAAGTGIYAATRDKKSHLEAIDELALERADEFIDLHNNGVEVTLDKVASVDEDDLDRVITELAWHKLAEAGYVE